MILVTGATGNIGRVLVDELLTQDAKVRAVTRDPAAATFPAGVEVVKGDPSSPETLVDALAGVTAVFVNPIAFLDQATMSDASGRFLTLARERGVTRVVMLSTISIRDDAADQSDPVAAWQYHIEQGIKGSGMEWTILRSSEFARNLVFQGNQRPRAIGAVFGPYAGATTAPIHERDIAAVAARALLTGEHAGAVYQLTGPESLARQDMARIIGDVLGTPVRFQEVPPEAAMKEMLGHGTPPLIAEAALRFAASTVGRPADVSTAVEQVLGRPALTYAQWVADHAAEIA